MIKPVIYILQTCFTADDNVKKIDGKEGYANYITSLLFLQSISLKKLISSYLIYCRNCCVCICLLITAALFSACLFLLHLLLLILYFSIRVNIYGNFNKLFFFISYQIYDCNNLQRFSLTFLLASVLREAL